MGICINIFILHVMNISRKRQHEILNQTTSNTDAKYNTTKTQAKYVLKMAILHLCSQKLVVETF